LFIAKRNESNGWKGEGVEKTVHFKCLITTICEVQSNLWFSRWRSGPFSDREQCDLANCNRIESQSQFRW